MSQVLVLASDLARSGEAAKSGPIGLAVILVLCIACYFLFKSMSRHLKTVREDFPGQRKAERAAARVTAAQVVPVKRTQLPGAAGVDLVKHRDLQTPR